MSNSSSSSSGGIGFFGLLAIVFITLKLLAVEPVASWSWWWVTAPLWGGFVVFFGIAILFVIIAALIAAFGSRR